MTRWLVASLILVGCFGCKKGGGPPPDPGMDASVDAAVDAGDASTDASTDAGMDGAICEFTMCPTGCADLDTDPQNCGSCSNACATPMVCAGGSCVDPP